MKYEQIALDAVEALARIAEAMEKHIEQNEPVYFIAEGQVNIDDLLKANLPPGRIVRCTDPRMAVLNGTNDQHLKSIADSLAKLANPLVEVGGPEPDIFCGKAITENGILTCHAAPGHEGDCWASR